MNDQTGGKTKLTFKRLISQRLIRTNLFGTLDGIKFVDSGSNIVFGQEQQEFMNINKQTTKCDYIVKIPVIGARGCGKTNFISRFCYDDYIGYSKETIGIDFSSVNVVRSGKQIKVQFWDVIIPEKDGDSIRQLCAQGAIAIIFVYSITDSLSLDYAQTEIARMKKSNWVNPQTSIFLIGTKADMKEEQKVDTQKAKSLSEDVKAIFMEVSAKNRIGISEFQSLLGGTLIETIGRQESGPNDNMVNKFYKILKN